MSMQNKLHNGPHPALKTGDVLACYGRGFTSRLISWFTPRWRFWELAPSHVAIIIDHSDAAGDLRTYVYESTTLGTLPDAIHGHKHSGVQAHLFGKWLNNYPGSVYLHRLSMALGVAAEGLASGYAQRKNQQHTKYDTDQAINSATPIINRNDDSELFCSEFVAFVLQNAGIVSYAVQPSEIHPLDVIQFSCLDKGVRIKKANEKEAA